MVEEHCYQKDKQSNGLKEQFIWYEYLEPESEKWNTDSLWFMSRVADPAVLPDPGPAGIY